MYDRKTGSTHAAVYGAVFFGLGRDDNDLPGILLSLLEEEEKIKE